MYLGGNGRWVRLMFSYKKNVQTNKELKLKRAFIGVASVCSNVTKMYFKI